MSRTCISFLLSLPEGYHTITNAHTSLFVLRGWLPWGAQNSYQVPDTSTGTKPALLPVVATITCVVLVLLTTVCERGESAGIYLRSCVVDAFLFRQREETDTRAPYSSSTYSLLVQPYQCCISVPGTSVLLLCSEAIPNATAVATAVFVGRATCHRLSQEFLEFLLIILILILLIQRVACCGPPLHDQALRTQTFGSSFTWHGV